MHLGHDRDRVLVDAHVGRRRREDVEQQDQRGHPDDRDDHDDDLRRRVPRQPLQLDEDQPDEERVDAEEEQLPLRLPFPGRGLRRPLGGLGAPDPLELLLQRPELRRQGALRLHRLQILAQVEDLFAHELAGAVLLRHLVVVVLVLVRAVRGPVSDRLA